MGRIYMFSRGERYGVSLSAKTKVARTSPKTVSLLREEAQLILLLRRPNAVRKSKRVNDSWFSKTDNENEMSLVASSTSAVYQKSLRYSTYIAEGSLKYLSFNGEEFTSSVEVRDSLSLSAKPKVANPALTVPLRGRGTTDLLLVRPIAVRKSKRVNDSWFSKTDNENEMSLVASSTSAVYQKSLRYSTYIAEGDVALVMLEFNLGEGISKHHGVPEDVDSKDMIVAGFGDEDEKI
ncbi:hypothetical protein Tco_0002009 [Tanacetum coccineum]